MTTETQSRVMPRQRSWRLPRIGAIATHGTMLVLAFVCIFPVYWMVISSLKPESEIFSPGLWPAAPSLDNFAFVLTSIPMLRMLLNSILVSFATALLQVLTGLLAAYGLVVWRFRLSQFI
jgi:sn-glycerol 3-phosphate transport system permease protein